MNNKQIELQQRIKLLMEYDMKKTLTENIHPILEQGSLLKLLGVADNVLDDIIKKGKLKTTSGTSVKSMDDLKNSLKRGSKTTLDDASKTLLHTTFLKNPSISLGSKEGLIKSFTGNPTVVSKYSTNTNQQIYKKFIKSGYPDDVAEEIANKLKPKTVTSNSSKPTKTNTMSQELTQESKDLFGNLGKKLTSSQIEGLNRASAQITKGVSKLSTTQIVGLENSLKSMGVSLEVLIQKLSKAKDLRSQERAKKFKKVLDTVVLYTNTATKSIGDVKIWNLSKATLTVMGGVALLAGVNWLSKTSIGKTIIEYMPDVWSFINTLGTSSTTPETTTPETTTPETTTPVPDEENKPDTREKIEW